MERMNRQPAGLNDMQQLILAINRDLTQLKKTHKTFICVSPRDKKNNLVEYMKTFMKYLAYTKAIDLNQSQISPFERFEVNDAYLYMREESNLRIIFLPNIQYDISEAKKSMSFRQLDKQHILISQLTSTSYTENIRLFIMTSCSTDMIEDNELAKNIKQKMSILQKQYFMESQIYNKITFLINVRTKIDDIKGQNLNQSIKECKHYSKIVIITNDEKPFYKFPKNENQTLEILSQEKDDDRQQLFQAKMTSKYFHMIDHLKSSQDIVVVQELYQVISLIQALLIQIRHKIYSQPINPQTIDKLHQINEKFSAQNWEIKNRKQFIKAQELFGQSDRAFLYAYILDGFNKTHDQVEKEFNKVKTDHADNLIANDKNVMKFIRAIIQQLQSIKHFFPQILAQFDYSLFCDLAQQFFNAVEHMYTLKSQHYGKVSQLKDTYKLLKSQKQYIIELITGLKEFQKPNIDHLNHTQKQKRLLLYRKKLDLALRIITENKLEQKSFIYDRKKNQIKYEKGSTVHKLACLSTEKKIQVQLYKQSLQCLYQLYQQVQIQFNKDQLLLKMALILKSLNRIDLTIQIQKFLRIHGNIAIHYKLWMAEYSRFSNQSLNIIRQAIDYFTNQYQKEKAIQFYDLMISNNIPQIKHYHDQKKKFIKEYQTQYVDSLRNNNYQNDRNAIKILNQNFNRALIKIKAVYQAK